jgi:uncharacterized protein (TIGR00251 family)
MSRPPFAARAKTSAAWLTIKPDRLRIALSVRPAAGRQAVLRVDEHGPVVALKSPADKGKANNELLRMLARAALVPVAYVRLARGEKGRRKEIEILTAHPQQLAVRLQSALGSAQS